METFRDKFCRHFDVPLERYGETVLDLTLYPHARWLPPGSSHRLFAADRDFIDAVGRLTRWQGFPGEAREFQHDPRNRSFRRRSLRLRVSVRRMRSLFSEVWGTSIPAADEALSGDLPGSLLAD